MTKIRRIEKKTLPEFFEEVLKGNKKFDLRLADFKVKKGDILVLREWDPKAEKYTGRVIEKKISFVLGTKNANFWTKREVGNYGFVVMGFKE